MAARHKLILAVAILRFDFRSESPQFLDEADVLIPQLLFLMFLLEDLSS